MHAIQANTSVNNARDRQATAQCIHKILHELPYRREWHLELVYHTPVVACGAV